MIFYFMRAASHMKLYEHCMNFAHDVWYPKMKTNHTSTKMYFHFRKFIYRWQYPQGGNCYRKQLKGKVVGLRNEPVVARHVAQL